MEKYSYEEIREWFWVRTLIWCVPAVLASIFAHFWYAGEAVDMPVSRTGFAIGVGALSVIIGVLSAFVSLQWPWMRSGRWYGFALTGPLCAAMSAFIVFLISGLIMGIVRDDVAHLPPPSVIDTMYKTTIFVMGTAAFWSFIFGSWFALRRDRYFVESI